MAGFGPEKRHKWANSGSAETEAELVKIATNSPDLQRTARAAKRIGGKSGKTISKNRNNLEQRIVRVRGGTLPPKLQV
jgi:hypothetical protein